MLCPFCFFRCLFPPLHSNEARQPFPPRLPRGHKAARRRSMAAAPQRDGADADRHGQDDEELRAKDGEPNAGGGAHGVWIVAHRRELVEQIEATVQKSLRTVHNPNVTELSPSSKLQTQNTPGAALTPNSKLQTRNPVSVYSIQWLSRHLGEIGERPRLVVIDEAHHALAETYKELWLRCPEAKFLGMTATPCRLTTCSTRLCAPAAWRASSATAGCRPSTTFQRGRAARTAGSRVRSGGAVPTATSSWVRWRPRSTAGRR